MSGISPCKGIIKKLFHNAHKSVSNSATRVVSNELQPKMPVSLVRDRFIKQNTEKLRGLDAVELAKDFKRNLVNDVADWKDAFPKNNEVGSELTRRQFTPYTNILQNMKEDDVKKFFRCLFGTDSIKCLRESARENNVIDDFVKVIESKIGSMDSFYN